MRESLWRIVLMLAVLSVVAVAALPAFGAAGGKTYRHTYDGCKWTMRTEWWIGSAPDTHVRDENGGCHYLTAYAKSSDGREYHRYGPSTHKSVWANMQDQGSFYGRGRITTWEHEWWQDTGWKYQQV